MAKTATASETVAVDDFKVISAELHAPIRMDGHTESNLNRTKMPNITSMRWTNGFLIIKSAKSTHVLPAAAVKDSIVE